MNILPGDKLTIADTRKGRYHAVALKPFDTEADEWFPVAVDQKQAVNGMNHSWLPGEEIPCRRTLARVERRAT